MTAREFEALKKKIDDRKQSKAMLEGELSASMKQLKELGFNSTEEAEAELKKLDRRIAKLETQLADTLETLEKEYDL